MNLESEQGEGKDMIHPGVMIPRLARLAFNNQAVDNLVEMQSKTLYIHSPDPLAL